MFLLKLLTVLQLFAVYVLIPVLVKDIIKRLKGTILFKTVAAMLYYVACFNQCFFRAWLKQIFVFSKLYS